MEPMTRRTLLRGAATAAVAVPLATLVPEDLAYAGAPLTRATFLPRKGTVFTARGRQFRTATKLRLVAVEDLDARSRGQQRRFSITFVVLSGPRLTSGTYPFTHPSIGAFSLFVQPTGRRGDLQAVFNAR